MDTGSHLIAAVLGDDQALKSFVTNGFDSTWISDPTDFSRAAIFGDDTEVYKFILRHWEQHRAAPSREYFKRNYPAYRLPREVMPASDILALSRRERLRVHLEVAGGELIDLHDAGKYEDALEQLTIALAKIRKSSATQELVEIAWDSAAYDLEARLNRKVVKGVPMGIAKIDDAFAGWQPGQLVTFLGRAKSAKTAHMLKSALAAHEVTPEREGHNVLVISVEITADSIADRLDCFAAGIEPELYTRGLSGFQHVEEIKKVRAAKAQRGKDEFLTIIQPTSRFTIPDLEACIERLNPSVVYVDGFYFMIDHATGKPGGNWEGHDNLAREMKELAMRRGITIVTTMQVREKQTHGKGNLDDNTMMGGTGLIMASDMVLTLDMDNETKVNTIVCSRSRTAYLPSVHGTWKWRTATFEPRVDEWSDDEWGDNEDD